MIYTILKEARAEAVKSGLRKGGVITFYPGRLTITEPPAVKVRHVAEKEGLKRYLKVLAVPKYRKNLFWEKNAREKIQEIKKLWCDRDELALLSRKSYTEEITERGLLFLEGSFPLVYLMKLLRLIHTSYGGEGLTTKGDVAYFTSTNSPDFRVTLFMSKLKGR